MRTSLRAGVTLGGLGSLVLCLLQTQIGLAIAPGVILVGILAGLAVAKGLERPYYGRQLEEGARAGVLACGLTGFLGLLSLLVAGPHDLATLTTRSHLFALDFALLMKQFSTLSWAGVDVLIMGAASIIGLVWAAVLAQVFGWSKSARVVQSVRLAQLKARALQRGESWALAGSTAGPALRSGARQDVPIAVSVAAGASTAARATPAIGSLTESAAPTIPAIPVLPSRQPAPQVARPAGPRMPPAPSPASPPPIVAAPIAAAPPQPTAAAKRSPRGRTSDARPVEGQLTREMRKALEAWATQESLQNGQDRQNVREGSEDQPAAPSSGRTRKPSTFLNSASPAKRNRKKNQTRDWLC